MKSYRISPRELLSAFSTAENRLCRTLVRRRDDFRRFCIFFISPRGGSAEKAQTEKALGEAKKAQTEKADKSEFWAFIRHKYKES